MSKFTFYIKPNDNTSYIERKFITAKYSNHSTFHEGDAGLDLFCPRDLSIYSGQISHKIDLGINCELKDENGNNLPYLLMPRSSTGSKTKLRMSNSLGLIDAGYRGPICACVDNIEPISLVNRSLVYLETIDFTLILSLISAFYYDNQLSNGILWFSVLLLHFLLLYHNNIFGSLFSYSNVSSHHIKQGDRLFQLVPLVSGNVSLKCKVVEELSQTTRGEDGFGSTDQSNNSNTDDVEVDTEEDGDNAENIIEIKKEQ